MNVNIHPYVLFLRVLSCVGCCWFFWPQSVARKDRLCVTQQWYNEYVMKDITDTVNVMSALTVTMLWVTITSALDVSIREVTVCPGHYYYVHATACPVQIRAHHHMDVYTNINDIYNNTDMISIKCGESLSSSLANVGCALLFICNCSCTRIDCDCTWNRRRVEGACYVP